MIGKTNDTITALASAAGAGAVAIIRVSGPETFAIVGRIFFAKSKKCIEEQESHTIHLGHIKDDHKVLDEVLVSLFKNPRSYTGEDVIEINCHGSAYIQQEILQLLLRKGCRLADAGEFTLRAFLNGKMDLSQAEAVADLIASDSEAAHQVAIQQMRGGFSNEIKRLRDQLLNFASLLELELDFAEEDVEFADRSQFVSLLLKIEVILKRLIDSFAIGNVIKQGIPVAIVGAPNAGKSTLLNALLNEDRAIVSDIAGTTRDTIEDEIAIGGLRFRFIDTAGIRETKDSIESIGIEKTFEKIGQAQVVLYLVDSIKLSVDSLKNFKNEIAQVKNQHPLKPLIIVLNKVDQLSQDDHLTITQELKTIENVKIVSLSAKQKTGITTLTDELLNFVNNGELRNDETIVTNSRHYDSLIKALEEIQNVQAGMSAQLSGDLLAIDLRESLYHLGNITGEVTNDELLGNIFANFCIGK
ncbi:tRNA uridine-5-carboxymethylaminomethyl(34) synthesis GTPase MnmE [Aquimarina agarivorans]|uniref:tRNA uridine-5-carboxymethylaminomethyl(34) synthesis GTPase MnmE n=1 Tax=Aquimarina agarivorans TaxID=980584 RepID=UPI000248F880|nr:tRNA uridine-5-carboxymethylaminomethyl(34) synthesis GTPase MnmE [Aquimarina agarivorans]